jgi:hypothetical protein
MREGVEALSDTIMAELASRFVEHRLDVGRRKRP